MSIFGARLGVHVRVQPFPPPPAAPPTLSSLSCHLEFQAQRDVMSVDNALNKIRAVNVWAAHPWAERGPSLVLCVILNASVSSLQAHLYPHGRLQPSQVLRAACWGTGCRKAPLLNIRNDFFFQSAHDYSRCRTIATLRISDFLIYSWEVSFSCKS